MHGVRLKVVGREPEFDPTLGERGQWVIIFKEENQKKCSKNENFREKFEEFLVHMGDSAAAKAPRFFIP